MLRDGGNQRIRKSNVYWRRFAEFNFWVCPFIHNEKTVKIICVRTHHESFRTQNGEAKGAVQDPALVWQVAIAPSGLEVYSGDRLPDWRGNLFAGGLIAQDVRRIILADDGQVIAEEAIRIGARVRDVRQGPDGFLYVLTDENAGRLIRIHPAGSLPDSAP